MNAGCAGGSSLMPVLFGELLIGLFITRRRSLIGSIIKLTIALLAYKIWPTKEARRTRLIYFIKPGRAIIRIRKRASGPTSPQYT